MFVDIAGYEGLYAVNKKGDVWSYKKDCKVGARGGVTVRGGIILKPAIQRKGHLRVVLIKDGIRKQHLVHRLVAKSFIKNPDNLQFVNHIDCNPSNNHVSNLEWCTASQNAKHAFDKGLISPPKQYGENNSQAKIDKARVLEIRSRYEQLKNCSAVAREFGYSAKYVNEIINRKRWSCIP